MNFNQLINEIRKMNPGVEIRIGDPNFDSRARDRIFSSIPLEQLKLPEGYYSNDKNGITNKHNSETGVYTSLSVESLSNMVVGQTYPNVDASKLLETTNVREIAIALQKLNPGVNIKLSLPAYDTQATSKIWCDVAMNELALPEPFYSNGKNGITNKHYSQNGMYVTIDVEDIKKAHPETLMETGYDLNEEKRKQYDLDSRMQEYLRQAQMGSENYTYDQTTGIPQEQFTKPLELNPQTEMLKMGREKRRFTILKKERAMDHAQRLKNRSAIMAGICILGAAVAVYFNGQNIHEVLQHELNALYSWEALGQYLQDLGPLATVLSAGAGGFIAKYFKNSRKFKQAQQEFIDFNDSLENSQTLGGNENAKSR